jgi:hypothetical protein
MIEGYGGGPKTYGSDGSGFKFVSGSATLIFSRSGGVAHAQVLLLQEEVPYLTVGSVAPGCRYIIKE